MGPGPSTTLDDPPEGGALGRATVVVERALRVCAPYGRDDVTAQLRAARRALAEPNVHVVVAGEFKQGKSSLVNALLGHAVCPVDDDVSTAVPTYVRHAAEPTASLVFDAEESDGTPLSRSAIAPTDAGRYVVEGGEAVPAPAGARLAGVEIGIDHDLLAQGLVLVDTPGVGGLGSAHAAASLAATAMADAVLFVTDASQELTRTEMDFLRQARQACDTVVCVLTKTDFYPAWRRIRDIDRGHLGPDVPLIAVSSALRQHAVHAGDGTAFAESGFAELVAFVAGRAGGTAADRVAAGAVAEVLAVCDRLGGELRTERAALADPAAAAAVVAELTAVKQRVEELRGAAARWSQTLNDGIADLTSDVDHDLRARIRGVTQEADETIDTMDPGDGWPQMQSWLHSRISQEMLSNYALLRTKATALSEQVAEHFRQASGEVLDELAVRDPAPLASQAQLEHSLELEKMRVGKQAMVALRGAYGGIIMFTVLGSLAGIALAPISLGIGLVMGHKGLRDEKKRQLRQRRAQAKNAVRRYCDEVTFVVGKDSRDTLRRIQRQLRDHYSGLAEELNRSNAQALAAAGEAANRSRTDRERRLAEIDAELARLLQLRQLALSVTSP
ncbi:dynamin family protein [Luedemannella helvata]|uniref:dynamin family protein n=1 Tax=Luedemannella helvata TaxID=349315 RepID=UPI003CD07475